MGLDSVELVMQWEDFFHLEIPDHEASKISTIADAVNYISIHVKYVDRGISIKDEVLKNVTVLFSQFKLSISSTDLIFKVIPVNEEQFWKEISQTTP